MAATRFRSVRSRRPVAGATEPAPATLPLDEPWEEVAAAQLPRHSPEPEPEPLSAQSPISAELPAPRRAVGSPLRQPVRRHRPTLDEALSEGSDPKDCSSNADAGRYWRDDPTLTITYQRPEALRLPERRLRKHPQRQMHQLMASLQAYGFINPVLVDSQNGVIAGVARVEAARQLSVATIPTIAIGHLTPQQLRTFRIADNKLGELSDWNLDELKIEIEELALADPAFDLELTGFSTSELDALLAGPIELGSADDVVEPVRGPAISREGDLWVLGPHRLLCGNALEASSYTALMAGETARQVITDPPYNVRIDGHVCGKGAIRHAEFAMASGEMSVDDFIQFLTQAFGALRVVCVDGAIVMVFMDWRHAQEILEAGLRVFDALKNMCVWVKDNGGEVHPVSTGHRR